MSAVFSWIKIIILGVNNLHLFIFLKNYNDLKSKTSEHGDIIRNNYDWHDNSISSEWFLIVIIIIILIEILKCFSMKYKVCWAISFLC